jgi:hypothetical protein
VLSVNITQAATTFGFSIAATELGDWGVQNISGGPYRISTLNILLIGETFFDTMNIAPGTSSSNWNTLSEVGSVIATYPPDFVSDGAQAATIYFSSFDPSDIINFFVDLDIYSSPDGDGEPLAAIISATFRDIDNNFIGSQQTVLTDAPFTLNGYGYTRSAAIPEPSALLLGGLGALALFRRRRI